MFLFNLIGKFTSHLIKYIHIVILLKQLQCTSSVTIMKWNQINQNITILQQKENTSVNNVYISMNENGSTTEINNEKTRNKRWANLFLGMWGMCLHYPLCCDVDGEDTCSFFCPVCPVKRDICKLFLDSIIILNTNVCMQEE